jgi:cysteine-rich repeat protein
MVLFFAVACVRPARRAPSPADAGDGPLAERGLDTSAATDVLVAEARADRQAEAPERVCGNQRRERGEQCDDGNTLSGDGCSSTCQLECGDAGVEPCMDACFFDCAALCCTSPAYCGDGNLDTDLREECDLGDSNGVPVDQTGKPSNAIDARVQCTAECKLGTPGLPS